MAQFRVPFIGPWKAKLTRIYRMGLIDCVPNAIAIAYGSAVAAFHIVWAIVGPECVDMAWDRVKRRPGGHRRFSMRGFSVGPLIGHSGSAMVTSAIALGDIAQKIGFYLAFIDGTINGVMYGSSMILRYSGCANVGIPYAQFNANENVPALLPAATFIMTTWFLESSLNVAVGPTGAAFFLSAADYVTVVVTTNQGFNKFPPLPDCSYTIRVVDGITDEELKPTWATFGNIFAPDKTHYSGDFRLAAGAHNLYCIVTKTEGVLYFERAQFTITIGKLHDPIQVWKCGGKALNLPI